MIDYSRYQNLLVEKRGRIAVVTLNRPEVLNAVDGAMHRELASIWLDLAADEEVYAVVLTGAGRAFSAGGDLRQHLAEQHQSFAVIRETLRDALLIVDRMIAFDRPVVAAINGPAAGLGCTLAVFCDLLVASDRARIGDTHVTAGVVAGDGALIALPLMVGMHRAKEMLLTGRVLDARQAEQIGLFNEVVPHEQLLPRALELANTLASQAPWAVRWTKLALNHWLKLFAASVFPSALALECLTMFTDDYGEAMRAFLEKRRPEFRGK